jgi:hypothetical protein
MIRSTQNEIILIVTGLSAYGDLDHNVTLVLAWHTEII